jgi:hypothetical protein
MMNPIIALTTVELEAAAAAQDFLSVARVYPVEQAVHSVAEAWVMQLAMVATQEAPPVTRDLPVPQAVQTVAEV